MSAQPGGSTPNAFVFPPFAPPVFRAPAPPEPAPAPPQELPEEPAAEDDFAMEVPLPAHDIGDPDDEEAQPWETPAPPAAAEELPWLEMPSEGPRVHPRFGEVADRLESIARALREDPDAFLAGNTSDPLGLLVTGFVLGYSRR